MEKPKIRFKGYQEDWEQRKLEDYLEVSNEKNRDELFGKEDVLSVSGEVGIVNQIEFQGRSFAGASVANYGIVEVGDVVYTKSPLKSNPYGIIKTNKGKTGIVSTLYAVYKPKENVDSEFVQIYFESDFRMNSYMHPLVNKGAKNDMKVSDANALKGPVFFPKIEEQIAISQYFNSLDHLITLHQRKCEEMKTLKKYMLQKMFPQNGQSVPQIRFSGFTEDWEQRKLGEYVNITSGEAPSKFEEGTELYVKVDDLNYNDKYVVDTQNKVAEHSTVKRVTKGSVVFPKRGAAIMTNKVRIMGIDSYMDTNMMALTSEKLDSEFLYNIISKEGLYKIADTSTIPQINNKHVEPYEVTIPSLDEQRRIGAYFKQLDDFITLHQQKCDELRNIKKFMLQNMFI